MSGFLSADLKAALVNDVAISLHELFRPHRLSRFPGKYGQFAWYADFPQLIAGFLTTLFGLDLLGNLRYRDIGLWSDNVNSSVMRIFLTS